MIIGNFRQHDEAYAGNLYGLALNIPFVTINPIAKSGKSPDFTVWGATSEDEVAVELGAAWSKTSKVGKAYLSVKLDGPMLAQPVNCALIQQQDETYALVWTRKEADDEQAAA